MSLANSSPERPKTTRGRRGRAILVTTAVGLALGGVCLAWDWLRLRPTQRFVVTAVVDETPREVQVEAFLPKPVARLSHPAIVLLHGVDRAARYRSAHYRTARWLADQGYAVFFVHYFNSGDYDDLWLLREDGDLDVERINAACRRDAARWTTVVAQSLKSIASRPDVDRSRIALDGNSLGGFVALSVTSAALQDEDIPDLCAVVVNWGALFEGTEPARNFPPTLFVHGERDTIVPLESARSAADAIRAVEREATLVVVPGAPHVARSQESDALTLQFFKEHLGSRANIAPRVDPDAGSLREAAIGASLWTIRSPFPR